jgi:hypothetical protein
MKMFKILGTLLVTALLVAGCGGGSTLSGNGGGTASVVSHVSVSTAPSDIAADGTTSATLSATVTDASNVAVSGVEVSFAVSAGGVLTVTQRTTDGSGVATATVKASTATAGTTLTVTATAGSVSGTASVNVIAIQQALSLATDSPQIPSDGSKSAALSAQLTDANNNALAGVTVSFVTNSGVLQIVQAVTDATGVAKATLSAGTDPTNRRIDVTASAAGTMPVAIPVFVTGTTLSLTGPANLVLNGTGTYQMLLTDASNKGIANKIITLTSASGNDLSFPTLTTDASGQASVVLTATNAAAATDTLTVAVLGLSAERQIAVSNQSFTVIAPTAGTKIFLNSAPVTVTAHWLSGGAAQVGQSVDFSSTRGTLSAANALTDASGNASVTITSNNAGPAVIAASGNSVSAEISIDFVAQNPTQIVVQASPATVAVQGQSTITATARDGTNNLVEGQTVSFVLNDTTGGSLSVASAVTDAQGRAQTIYTAGNSTSAANGVSITATVPGHSDTTTLSVGGQAVYLSLGTGNTINAPDDATYSITYAVFAIDALGAARANTPIVFSVLPVSYEKGHRLWSDAAAYWTTVVTTLTAEPSCANEDTDYSGNMTSQGVDLAAGRCPNAPYGLATFAPVKDYNCSGVLDPGNVASVAPSTGVTGSDGKLLVKVNYPKSYAYYATVMLTATTNVSGTQSSTSSTFMLPGSTTDFGTKANAPPGPTSPWGNASVCSSPL